MINVNKFVASLIKHYCEAYDIDRTSIKCWFDDALKEQGLEYKNGEIVKTQRRIVAEAKEALYTAEIDSEDEKMKKEAISIIQSYMNICDEAHDPCYTGEKVIAWLEKQSEQILANSANISKDEKKTDKYEGYCEGCNNVKGCVTCVDGDQWAHYKEVEQKSIGCRDMATMLKKAFGNVGKKTWGGIEVKDILTWLEMQDSQKPTTVWHDVSEIPYLYNEEELLVECKKSGNTRNYVVKYDVDTRQFHLLGIPIDDVTRWAYVSDVLSQSEVTKKSEQVPSLLDLKLMDCPLSVKTTNGVKVAINKPAKDVTLGDIIKCNKAELLALRNFGKVSLKELEDFLADYGLKLGEE